MCQRLENQNQVMTLGIVAGRLYKLKKLAELVGRDELAGRLNELLDELGQPSDADLTKVDADLMNRLWDRLVLPKGHNV